MTDKQRKMLDHLFHLVEEYDGDPNTPLSRYGENDTAIVADPRWQKIREYAKLLYEELSGEDLDAWEKSRPKQTKPAKITRKKITPEEMRAEMNKIYPYSLIEKFEKQIGDDSLYNYFVCLLMETWKMSNKDYQERFWDRKEHPIYDGENCMKTVAEFLSDTQIVLQGGEKDIIPITPKQREVLQKLSSMVEAFKNDPTTPDDPGYGLNDAEIIKDPKWQKVREYAELVYEELSGDKLK